MDTRGRTIEEMLKEGRLADKVDRDRAELWAVMVKTEAWKIYQEMLNARINILGEQILAPAGSVDAMVAAEFVKGAMSGLVMARDLPGIVARAIAQEVGTEDVAS